MIFLKKRNNSDKEQKLERITNTTVEQHRREILESARRFKYPVQYEKHRLVISATLIGITFLIIFFSGVVWRLYLVHDTNDFLYKITQVIPFRIGQIDQQPILYSDYLAYYRSAWHYHLNKDISLQSDPTEESEKQLSDKYSRSALINAAKIALVKKIAQDKNISVSQEEIDKELNLKLTYNNEKMSLTTFDSVIKDYYGLSRAEYRQIFLQYPLLLRKVVYEIDDRAKATVKDIRDKIKQHGDDANFETIAKELENQNVSFVDSGVIMLGANDNGLSDVAMKQNPNSISETFVSYNLNECNILKVIAKNDSSLHYQALKVPLMAFNEQYQRLESEQKIINYIGLDLNKK